MITEFQPPVVQLKSKFAVIVTANDVNQLPSVATLPARLFILTGSICNKRKIIHEGGWKHISKVISSIKQIDRA